MPRLALAISAIQGEHPISLASRLAAKNGVPLREFLSDMGIRTRSLMTGETGALSTLAELAGQDPADLAWNTPLTSGKSVQLRGQQFAKSSLGGPTLRGCQLCLCETGAIQSHWLVERLEICLKHQVPLAELWRDSDPLARLDVAIRTGQAPEPAPLTRDVTPFERWLEARLTGASHKELWLDQFALGAAAEFCFALGRAAHAHRLRKWRGTPAEIAHLMPAIGFELCLEGEDHLHQALRELQLLTSVPENGPKLIYGGLFELLSAPDLHEDLRPFRAIFRRHIEATWPLDIGDEVLGEPVLAPLRYALPSLAGYWGMDAGDLRDLLIKRGVLETADLDKDLRWLTIDLAYAEALAGEVNEGVDTAQFCRALGMNQYLFEALRADGVLDQYKSGETWDAWSARRLLDPLLYGAEIVHVPMQGWRTLGKAAAEQGISQIDMLSMIAQGQIPRVGRHIQRTGFEAILVDLTGTADTTASFEVFAAAQGIEVSDLKKLQSCGELASIELPPKHRTTAGKTKRLGLSPEAIQSFHAKFVSHRKLALSLKLSADALQAQLYQQKIAPAHGCRSVYLRKDCAALHDNSIAPQE